MAGVYYCMALSLYPQTDCEDLFSVVAQGLAWAAGAAEPKPVAKSSISALRGRIGWQPLADLVQRCCTPMADPKVHPGAFFQGLRLVVMDGSNFELPDAPDNVAQFGYPGSCTGHAGYPQAQCAVLAECATYAVLAGNLAPYGSPEWQTCLPLLGALKPGMLCLADRGFNGYEHWRHAQATGAELLWRCTNNRQWPVIKALEDSSYLSEIQPPRKERLDTQAKPITVRVIEYAVPGLPKVEPDVKPDAQPRYRLLSTLLDDKAAPALAMAVLYHQRLNIDEVFDELKTHLREGRREFRSKTAELMRQEFYGWVLAHYAVRWLLCQGASQRRMPHE